MHFLEQTRIVVATDATRLSETLVCPSSFPPHVRLEAEYACRRLGIIYSNSQLLHVEVDLAMQHFLEGLNHYLPTLQAKFEAERPGRPIMATENGYGYLSLMHGVLYETKAFLDLYARLIGKLLQTPGHQSPPGFSSANKVSGGRFISWLGQVGAEGSAQALELQSIFSAASQQWITSATKLRDDIAHFKDIPDLVPIHTSISENSRSPIRPEDISPPSLGGGVPINFFAEDFVYKLCTLVHTTRLLLPCTGSHHLQPIEAIAPHFRRLQL